MFSQQVNMAFISNRRSTSYPMAIFCFLFILFSFQGLAIAQSWYIKPSSEIPLRKGQGTEYKIVAVLSDGIEVTILEEHPPWVKIRTPNKKQGWILKRYLSDQPPLSRQVEELMITNEEFLKKETLLKQDLSSANVKINQITSERNTCIASLSKSRDDYDFLKNETADVMAIRNNLIKSEKKVKELTIKYNAVSKENTTLKKSQKIRWYLAGSGTLILGWLAGSISIRSRKRRSSLY